MPHSQEVRFTLVLLLLLVGFRLRRNRVGAGSRRDHAWHALLRHVVRLGLAGIFEPAPRSAARQREC